MSSALDLLVLAAIEEGINTVYRLRERAGLSPGTTSPTIHRRGMSQFTSQSDAGRVIRGASG